jgi:pSer/pThr/pTyr-binding forkhead associated (FHA) protein
MTVALVPLTEEAKHALGGNTILPIPHVPFRIGREGSRSRSENDLDLMESPSSKGLHISRDHIAIEQVDSVWFLIDRKSTSGTIVNGKVIGGHRKGGRSELRDGDVIVLGTVKSPYVYRFQLGADRLEQ